MQLVRIEKYTGGFFKKHKDPGGQTQEYNL
jgi:hypothetical protein